MPSSKEYKEYHKELANNNDQCEYLDQYTLQIILVREPESILFNMLFALFVVDCMVFSAHGVPIGDLADRLSVNLTLLLTAMAFKFVLSDTLPPTPYLTTMEKYVLFTFVVLFLQGISFWILAELYNYQCGDHGVTDWFTGTLNNSTERLIDNDCAHYVMGDRLILAAEVICWVVKNIWFAVRIVKNSTHNMSKKNDFVDLTGLQEFCMPEPLTFINEMNNSTRLKHMKLKKTSLGGGQTNQILPTN